MYYNNTDNKTYTESEIKALYPNTSFPSPFVAPDEFVVVFDTPQPTITELQIAYQDGTDIDVLGNRVVKWAVADKFTTSLEFDTYLDNKKAEKIETIISSTDLSVPVILNGITYNSGADSAGKIKGAIDLASLLLEPTVDIWDINDKTRTYSFPDAMDIVSAIAIDYRTNALARQARITAVNDIVVDVNGTYPTLADALTAINLI